MTTAAGEEDNGRRELLLPSEIAVSELAAMVGRRDVDVIRILMMDGITAVPSSGLPYERASQIAWDYGWGTRRRREG